MTAVFGGFCYFIRSAFIFPESAAAYFSTSCVFFFFTNIIWELQVQPDLKISHQDLREKLKFAVWPL